MSRILLLLIIVLWMSRSVAAPTDAAPALALDGIALFLGGLVVLVLLAGLWGRLIARTVYGYNLNRSLRRFNYAITIARVLIPAWFAVGIWLLGWGDLVDHLLGPVAHWPVNLPGMLIGTLPPFLAWAGLWWAHFPAERALREQNLLIQINEEVPIHPPPDLRAHMTANLRLQLLFTVVPVILILFLHDAAALAFWFGGVDLNRAAPNNWIGALEFGVQALSVVLVLLFVPEVLRRVLDTRPLPASPLRDRLEQLCVQTRLRYREILLWRTNFYMGNAAVMGMIPQSRYILLSDVLLERMDERQIEAVFAHEVGHVKHWHMGWYVVLFATLMLFFFAAGQVLSNTIGHYPSLRWMSSYFDSFMGLGSTLGFLLVFGFLSRGFERQADVYAARTMQATDALAPPAGTGPMQTHVGPYGADVFISALHRVAVVNNIPVETRSWRGRGVIGMFTGAFDWFVDWINNYLHGSIASRMGYIRRLSTDPQHTAQFDRRMKNVRTVLIASFVAVTTWNAILSTQPNVHRPPDVSAQEQSREARLSRRLRAAQLRPEQVSPAVTAIPTAAESVP